jgi:hypothetical protein
LLFASGCGCGCGCKVTEQKSNQQHHSKSAFIKTHNKRNGELYYCDGIYAGRTIDQAYDIAQITTSGAAAEAGASAGTAQTGVLEPLPDAVGYSSINIEEEVQLQEFLSEKVALQEQIQEVAIMASDMANEQLHGSGLFEQTVSATMSGSGGGEAAAKDSSGTGGGMHHTHSASGDGAGGKAVTKSSKSKLGGFPCAYDGCSDHR